METTESERGSKLEDRKIEIIQSEQKGENSGVRGITTASGTWGQSQKVKYVVKVPEREQKSVEQQKYLKKQWLTFS